MIDLNVELAKSGGNCFDDVMATVDLRYRKGIEMMYIDALRFRFEADSPGRTVGSRIGLDYSKWFQYLEAYHGYRLQLHPHLTPEQAMELIAEQLRRGVPVGLYLDSYCIPWDPKFETTHYTRHIILAVGMDPRTGLLLCSDPFFWKHRLPLEQRYFRDGFQRCLTFETAEPLKTERRIVWDDLRQRLCEWAELGRPADHFRAFIDAFSAVDLARENDGFQTFSETPLFTGVNELCIARNNFAKMLFWLARRHHAPAMEAMGARMGRIGHEWSIIRSMTTKMNVMFRNRRHFDIIGDIVRKITASTAEERWFLEQLIDVLGRAEAGSRDFRRVPAGKHETAEHPSGDIRRTIHVPLRHLFNNKGIETGSGIADFDLEGHCFTREGEPVERESAPPDPDLSFAFTPSTESDEADNVVCMGQSVALDESPIRGIMALGCCEHGSYTGTLTVEYADGTSEEALLGFAEWDIPMLPDGEVPYWKSRILCRSADEKLHNDVFIYAKKIPLSGNKPGLRLILPYMPTLHLFAVSVWS